MQNGKHYRIIRKRISVSILTNKNEGVKTRDRVFTVNNTLLTMVLTSVQQDKTLKNSVDLYYTIHQKPKALAIEPEQRIQTQKEEDSKFSIKKQGGQKYNVQLSKSLGKDISLNTAAYSKARERVPIELANDLLKSRIEQAENNYTHWNGYRVYLETEHTYKCRIPKV